MTCRGPRLAAALLALLLLLVILLVMLLPVVAVARSNILADCILVRKTSSGYKAAVDAMPEILPAKRELRTTCVLVVEREALLGIVGGVGVVDVLVDEDPRSGDELMRCVVVPFVQYSSEESCESDQLL
jgi:hypothetical protein